MGPSPRPLDVDVESRNGVARLALNGELDMASAQQLSEWIEWAEHDGAATIMLDLRGLSFIDSSGLRALIQAHDRANSNGHQLLLVAATEAARRLFEMTGTKHLLDEREAVSTLEQFVRPSGNRSPSHEGAGDQGG